MRELAKCGTRSAYMRHRRYKEVPCDLCIKAHTEYTTLWRTKNRTKSIASSKKWQTNNAERFKESQKKWEEKNSTHRKEYAKKWRSENLDKNRIKNRKRRATIAGNGYSYYTDKDVLQVYGNTCHICNLEIDLSAPRSVKIEGWEQGLQIDHVIPISKGGPDTLENVRPSHGICNIRKGNRKLLAS